MEVEARNQLDTVRRTVAHDWRNIAISLIMPLPGVLKQRPDDLSVIFSKLRAAELDPDLAIAAERY